MILDTLRHRHELFAAMEPSVLGEINTQVTAAMRSVQDALAPGLARAIKADLVYAVTRHRHFRSVPIFAEILADILASDYNVARPTALALAQGATLDPSPDAASAPVPATDLEFLRSIFVASASATNETDLVIDLGLGHALLKRIRQTVETTVASREADQVVRFLPELDAQIAEILCELAKESKTLPWALQVHRLRYHLIDADPTLVVWMKVHGARQLFELLLAIGGRGTASVRQIAQKLRKLKSLEDGSPEDPLPILEALATAGLVFAESGGNSDDRRYQLTPFAEELTAEAFARNLINTTRAPLAEIRGLRALYQVAVIQAVDASSAALAEIAREARPLSPGALKALLQRLVDGGAAALASETARNIAQNESSPWLKRVAEAFVARQFSAGENSLPMAKSLETSA